MKTNTELLADHTWLKIGGPAEITTPQSKEELVKILDCCYQSNRDYRILGNGSNLLVNDDGVDELVIKTTEACMEFKVDGTQVDVGASMMVPQFINKCISNGLGGYEYLYSVPGTVGGAIFMNAGRGESHNMTISDYLISVEVFADGEHCVLTKEDLQFNHRYSTFQDHNDWVILSATFDLPEQSQEKGNRLIKERMEKIRRRERSKPNAGSVFKSGSRLPLHKIPPGGLSIGNAEFVSGNRICHDGNATFTNIVRLITLAKLLNRLVPPFENPEIEWEIWN
ncbi:FAD-binding protein [Natronorubrum texcoconense]|uniref:UDP-N-acetylmuramate dehydrogenase n=1 Tax=Natronorubrum texcoconense TaxID=1095776 RepID=A0A1G8VPM5_9EURY|nr:FAD-binding protein [Natronorubrum texcoconense]SDJ68048.1 UDP-N-acetylmuramate dehydrogenase [Natronorubrum texcoconense]